MSNANKPKKVTADNIDAGEVVRGGIFKHSASPEESIFNSISPQVKEIEL